MLETTINYYTGLDVSHLSDEALIIKFHQVVAIREEEAKHNPNV